MFDDSQLEEIRARADLVEVIGAHVRLRQAGRNYIGLCPFHNEKTPSFTVSRERGFFHCFGCGAGGTVFNFLMRIEGLSFPEAVQTLATRYGVTLREHGGGPRADPSAREAAVRAAQTAAEFYAHVLWHTPTGGRARDYLERRGITRESAQTFKLGFAPVDPSSLERALERRGLRAGAVAIGLLRQGGSQLRDLFGGRLIFPIRDSAGRVVGFGGRVLDQRLPKYINSPESTLYSKARAVYGLYEARAAIGQRERAIVVEGYLDAIALAQAGFKETVATLGTSLTVEQLRLLARYTPNILACFDGDSAGQRASLRALRIFLEAQLLGRAIFMPPGHDPDTFVRERGAPAFAQLIEQAQWLVEYYVRREGAQAAANGPGGQAQAAERVAQTLGLIANPFEFDLLTRRAAEILGVREELLRQQARHGRSATARTATQAQVQAAPRQEAAEDMRSTAQWALLALATSYPQLRGEIGEGLEGLEMGDSKSARFLMDLCASALSQAQAEAYLTQHLDNAEQGRLSQHMIELGAVDLAAARRLMQEYLRALARWEGQQRLRRLRREAREDPNPAAAQAIILHRRGEGKPT
ncbi:MAG TPA: DNA primase [Candidatus Binataceae bacterium]|nr:DNA primase [Candidatus Binataceae bacterium]